MCTLGGWTTGVNRTLVLLELELDHARPVSPVNRRESKQSSLRGGGLRLALPPGNPYDGEGGLGFFRCSSPLVISSEAGYVVGSSPTAGTNSSDFALVN